jgi:hypothetical protein
MNSAGADHSEGIALENPIERLAVIRQPVKYFYEPGIVAVLGIEGSHTIKKTGGAMTVKAPTIADKVSTK